MSDINWKKEVLEEIIIDEHEFEEEKYFKLCNVEIYYIEFYGLQRCIIYDVEFYEEYLKYMVHILTTEYVYKIKKFYKTDEDKNSDNYVTITKHINEDLQLHRKCKSAVKIVYSYDNEKSRIRIYYTNGVVGCVINDYKLFREEFDKCHYSRIYEKNGIQKLVSFMDGEKFVNIITQNE